MTLFCDMDGVLADFDTHYETCFGVRPSKADDNVDWSKVRATKGFYENIPPMSDMQELWDFIAPFEPVILTGVPSDVEEAPANKIAWVSKNLGKSVPVITCKSKFKSRYCRPGDILIDDWEKYKNYWIDRGGIWVTHTSAKATIAFLEFLWGKTLTPFDLT